MLTITKEFQFDAAHRLWSDHLSEEQNRQIHGKCSKLHGHTYRLQVTVSGTVRDDGMILNFTELKTFVQEKLLTRYDHAYLNELEVKLDTLKRLQTETVAEINALLPSIIDRTFKGA